MKPARRLGTILPLCPCAIIYLLLIWGAGSEPAAGPNVNVDIPLEVFPRDVEWRLPFGCDFSGFFCEVALGFIPALTQTVHFSDGRSQNRLWLLKGACPNAFLQKLTTQERETIKRTMVEDDSRTSEDTALSIAVEHGDPCRIRVFARRPHALVLRVMSEGKFSERDLRCISHSAADEIWVPTRFHVEQLRSQLGHALSAGIYILPEIVPSHFFSPRMDSCEDDGSDADQRGKRGQPIYISFRV